MSNYNLALKVADTTAEIISEWKLPAFLADAARLASQQDIPRPRKADQAYTLALGLRDWHSENSSLSFSPVNSGFDDLAEPNDSQKVLLLSERIYSSQLRKLLRLIHLDRPRLYFTFLLLADHQARLNVCPKLVAVQSVKVFIPVVEMLGLWSLRRRWHNQSMSVLEPNIYTGISELIKGSGPYDEPGIRKFLADWELAQGAKGWRELPEERREELRKKVSEWRRDKRRPAYEKWALDRAYGFVNLCDELQMLLNEHKIKVVSSLTPIAPNPGTACLEKLQGHTDEELTSQWLNVRITCRSQADCYRVLGLVHSLGKHGTLRLAEHFSDYIAAYKPNGYQALVTSINYRNPETWRGLFATDLRVGFTIVTPEMYQRNEWGALYDLYHYPSGPKFKSQGIGWWRLRTTTTNAREEVRSYILANYDIDSQAERTDPRLQSPLCYVYTKEGEEEFKPPLYVFTPDGEIWWLEEGNTALDFAYDVHTELGNHAASIQVNGKDVPHHYPLRNGDLVKVLYQPHFRGPDLSWTHAVDTSYARTKVRQALTTWARSIHEGRAKIEQYLIEIINYYQREKNYRLVITTPVLNSFLHRQAVIRRLSEVAFYTQIRDDVYSHQKLVHNLISQELGRLIIDGEGRALTYLRHHIVLCYFCRPVPGEKLAAFEVNAGARYKGLRVHVAGNDCSGLRALQEEARPVRVEWVVGSEPEAMPRTLLKIEAEDCHGLLGDIINLAYDQSGVYLYRTLAEVFADGKAEIEILVEAVSQQHIQEILTAIRTMRNVYHVQAYLPTPSQQVNLRPGLKRKVNPYTALEATDRWTFYDREEPIKRILSWLEETPVKRYLIVHGQRRVGKTSLAKFLIKETLESRSNILPVFIDFQHLSTGDTGIMANSIIRSIREALGPFGLEPPPLETNIPPSQALELSLTWVSKQLRQDRIQKRLLLIIDEFNSLFKLDHQPGQGLATPIIFDNLRAVMHAEMDINWLLLVQDLHYYKPYVHEQVGAFYQQADEIKLEHLKPEWARKLITEPAKRSGITYKEGLVDEIISLTNGNPFLIQKLCSELVERLFKGGGEVVTGPVLRFAVNLLVSNSEAIFDHIFKYVSPIQRLVLTALAHLTEEGTFLAQEELLVFLTRLEAGVSVDRLLQTLDLLEKLNIVESRPTASRQEWQIAARLLHRSVRHVYKLEDFQDDWKTYQPQSWREELF